MSPLITPLAHLLSVLRPDWHRPGLAAAVEKTLRENPEKTHAEIAQAALNLAQDLNIRTPEVLTMDGRHWRTSQRFSVEKSQRKSVYDRIECPPDPRDCRRAGGGPCASCRVELVEVGA